MKIIVFVVSIVLFLFLTSQFSLVQARQGCCSHHGGVCGCGCCDGTSLSAKCAPYYPECSGAATIKKVSPVPLQSVAPKRSPIIFSSPKVSPRLVATPKATPKASPKAACSAVSDSVCPKTCTAGNDTDCCSKNAQYTWYENWGCYPKQLKCSDLSDGVCHSYCSAGNDVDCCDQVKGYQWYENWGCYPST